MSVTFHVPGPLRPFTGGLSEVEIAGSPATLQEALEGLWTLYPGLRDRVVTEQGRIRPHVNVFVGNEHIRNTGELATQLSPAAEISIVPAVSGGGGATKYVRYRKDSTTAYGILEGALIREIRGDLFGAREETGAAHPLSSVKLLHPCEPSKILAVGRNYKSHLGDRQQPDRPEMFYKPVSALQHPEEPIVIPPDAADVHFEGELVIVVGQRVSRASPGEARAAIFGVTCGNDVSERDWQNGPRKDLQWWRAKGADTFAPLGPAIVTGLDYGNLMLETRLNGEVVQKQSTADLTFDCPAIVRWVSRWVTLVPGDAIYTGTPGSTRPMKPGDIVEVEIEGIGVLRNRVDQ
ncbi:MAG: fumarylacetoacetate hydrolase family protein [Bryobacteraceae bacterium]